MGSHSADSQLSFEVVYGPKVGLVRVLWGLIPESAKQYENKYSVLKLKVLSDRDQTATVHVFRVAERIVFSMLFNPGRGFLI